MPERGYRVLVQGDGPARTFAEGAPVDSLAGRLRYCAPAAKVDGKSARISACASRTDTTRECVSVDATDGEYLDATGARFRLRVAGFSVDQSKDVVEGKVAALGTLQERTLALEFRFRVGTRVPAVPEALSPFFAGSRPVRGKGLE
jgi:hypothetical protein